MDRSSAEAKWEKYGLQEIKEVQTLPVSSLIIELGDMNTGFVAALMDVYQGNRSITPNNPIQVTWIREENKFLVTDGLHRLAESLFSKANKKSDFLCEIDWTGYSLEWSLPAADNRLL